MLMIWEIFWEDAIPRISFDFSIHVILKVYEGLTMWLMRFAATEFPLRRSFNNCLLYQTNSERRGGIYLVHWDGLRACICHLQRGSQTTRKPSEMGNWAGHRWHLQLQNNQECLLDNVCLLYSVQLVQYPFRWRVYIWFGSPAEWGWASNG